MIARGIVVGARGGLIEACLPAARVGDGVTIGTQPRVGGRICALDGDRALIAAYGAIAGLGCGTPVAAGPPERMMLGCCALGRAIDARGHPLDGGAQPRGARVKIDLEPLSPGERAPIAQPFWTRLPLVDGLLTFGRGARVGIFGAPGAGKSTLLESIVSGSRADAVVVALIGERGREAQRWIERRGPHETVICATSDRPAAERVRAAQVAAAHAAAMRARFARAARPRQPRASRIRLTRDRGCRARKRGTRRISAQRVRGFGQAGRIRRRRRDRFGNARGHRARRR